MHFKTMLTRSRFATILLTLATLPLCFGTSPAEAQPYPNEQLGANLGSVNGRSMAFVDVGIVSDRYKDASKDDVGWPTEDFTWVALDLRPCCWFGIPGRSFENIDDPAAFEPPAAFGDYDFSFKGQADVSGANSHVTVSDLTYEEATNTTRGTVTLAKDNDDTDAGDAILTLQFENTRRTPDDSPGSGVTDIHLLRPGFSLDEDYPTFNPAFIDAIAPFDKLRYMSGWQETNPKASFANGPAFLEWSKRKRPSDASQKGPSPRGEDRGVAYEYIIELSNETGTDPWINVPVSASDNYLQELANLFASELDPGLTVYVEYGNELWNPSFQTHTWNTAKAEEELQANSNDIINYDGEACNDDACNDVAYQKSSQRHAAKRTVAISKAFDNAFSDRSRFQIDLGWFALYGSAEENTEDMLAFIDANYESEVSDLIDEISTTGYYGFPDDIPEDASVTEILDLLESDIPNYYGTYDALADEYGLDLAVYEGGDNTSKGGSGSTNSMDNRVRAARDQGMTDLIEENIQNRFYPQGGDLYMYFTLTSGYNRYGTWGATDDINQVNRDFQYSKLKEIAETEPPGENQRPTASFTADPAQGQAPLEVSFDASASEDPDGSIASYEWDFGDGETATGETVTHTYQDPGTYTATLTATDDEGRSDDAEQTIQAVRDPDEAVAYAPLDTPPAAGETLTLEGAGGGFGWSGSWNVQDDYSGTGFGLTDTDPLAYTDDSGAALDADASDQYAVGGDSYKGSDRPLDRSEDGPFAIYRTSEGDAQYGGTFVGAEGTTLWWSFLARESDLDQFSSGYRVATSTAPSSGISKRKGERGEGADSATDAVSLITNGPGTPWTLSVYDSTQTTCSDDGDSEAGECYAEASSGVSAAAGETYLVVVKMEFADATSTASLYINPEIDGEPPAEADATLETPSELGFKKVYFNPGVRSGEGAVDEVRFGQSFTAVTPTEGGSDNQPPVASLTADPAQGQAPLEVSFDASGSEDPDGTIESYAWDFGDGTTGSGETVVHTYESTGTYTATLTVTDDAGATDEATQEISVSEGRPQATVAAAASAPAIDGTVDAVWDDARGNAIENVISGTVTDESDLSGSWKALWDADNLYYLVEITDDSKSSDNEAPYNDDSAEIYIDAENNGNSDREGAPEQCEYGENTFQLTFDPETGAVEAGFCSVDNTTGIDFTVTETDEGYRLEAALPWSTLGVEPASGDIVGTDVHANDDDDGGERDGKIAWSDTEDDAYRFPDVFGDATLAGQPGGGALTAAPRDTTVDAGETFLLPIDVTGETDEMVESYQFTLDYDATVVEATDVVVEGTASEGASGEQNIDSGVVKFAAAAASGDSDGLLVPPPTQESPLAYVEFTALEDAAGDAADVSFSEFLFNEGTPEVGTMAGTIEIGEVPYGDVSKDGQVTALDASQVLQAVVDLIEISAERRTRADVSGNGTVAAFDAALILDFVSGEIDTFPVERSQEEQQALASTQSAEGVQRQDGRSTAAAAEGASALRWGEVKTADEAAVSEGSEAGSVRLVPLHLKGASGKVRSVEVTAEFDAGKVTVESIELVDRLSEEDWILYHNTTERGQLRVAVAGPEALPEGEVLTARLRLSSDVLEGRQAGGGAEAGPSLRGRARLNEAPMQTLTEIELSQLPSEFALSGNAPNPFRTRTEIAVDLPEAAEVSVTVYDMLGRQIMTLTQSMVAGQGRTVPIEAGALTSGVYFYRVTAETEDGQRHTDTGRMVSVK